MKLRQQLASIDSDPSIDPVEKAKRKQNLLMLHSMTLNTSGNSTSSPVGGAPPSSLSSMSPLAPAFYPPGDTVGSVIGRYQCVSHTVIIRAPPLLSFLSVTILSHFPVAMSFAKKQSVVSRVSENSLNQFLCHLQSIAAHRDHFVRRLSVRPSVWYTFLVITHSYVS